MIPGFRHVGGMRPEDLVAELVALGRPVFEVPNTTLASKISNPFDVTGLARQFLYHVDLIVHDSGLPPKDSPLRCRTATSVNANFVHAGPDTRNHMQRTDYHEWRRFSHFAEFEYTGEPLEGFPNFPFGERPRGRTWLWFHVNSYRYGRREDAELVPVQIARGTVFDYPITPRLPPRTDPFDTFLSYEHVTLVDAEPMARLSTNNGLNYFGLGATMDRP